MRPRPFLFLVFALIALPVLAGPKTAKLRYPIGIQTVGEEFSELIPSGKPLPTVFSETFSTGADDQETVQIAIWQKTDHGLELVTDILVKELPRAPKATVRVVVTLTIDGSKNLRVKATVVDTAKVHEFGPYPVK
jgi:molecular chaperone DnaK (HSP70)